MAAWRHGQAAAQQFSVSPVSPFGAIFRSIVVQCERHGLLPDVSRSLSLQSLFLHSGHRRLCLEES